MRLHYTLPLTLAILALAAATAMAGTGFSTVLDPCNEANANPNPCGVSSATGSGVFVLDNDADPTLTFDITFSGLSSSQTAAHFHNAAAGVNGGVVRGIPLGNHIIGVWASTDAQPLTQFLVNELLNGRIYVNVHSQNYPAGEMRGQLRMDPTPVLASSWGRIKKLYR